MKQALIVDPHGLVGDFAFEALKLYDQTTVDSLQEAFALASGAEYQLVLIAMPGSLCTGALWTMVERLAGLTAGAALVMVHTEDADAAFQARARELGVAVLSAPLGVREQARFDEVTAG